MVQSVGPGPLIIMKKILFQEHITNMLPYAFQMWSWSIFDLENSFRLLMVQHHTVLFLDHKSGPKSQKIVRNNGSTCIRYTHTLLSDYHTFNRPLVTYCNSLRLIKYHKIYVLSTSSASSVKPIRIYILTLKAINKFKFCYSLAAAYD